MGSGGDGEVGGGGGGDGGGVEEGEDELGDRERLMWWWTRSMWSETVKGFGFLAETTSWVDCHSFFGCGRAAKEDGEEELLCSFIPVSMLSVGRKDEYKMFGDCISNCRIYALLEVGKIIVINKIY